MPNTTTASMKATFATRKAKIQQKRKGNREAKSPNFTGKTCD